MAAMISRRLSSRLLKPVLSSTSAMYSHSAPRTTTPEFQPSGGTLLHRSTRFCTDLSGKLFHEKPRYFQPSHPKNQGNHLANLKILEARFVLSPSAHNVTFGSRLSSAGNVRFFSTNEASENPNRIPDSEKLLNENSSSMLRPLSPNLSIYEPQLSSTSSISNRISGAFLTTIVLFSYLCLNIGSICFTYEHVYQSFFYLSKLILISGEITALALSYHLYIGVRHLLKNLH